MKGEKAAILAIGVIRKPHGIRGYMKVQSLSGEQRHFFSLKTVSLCGGGTEKTLAIEDCVSGAQDLLIKFEGIGTPEEAAAYRGWEIRVRREQACPLAPGQYYIAELLGCALVCGGKNLGTLNDVIDGAAHQTLEVVNAEGKAFLIPFVEAHVGEVNLEARTIELKSEWLLS
ncbi:MAG: ribosome maturation factor RimM [Spirochaetales bacterium]|jgi:16S rRNA processing protein RimM|nr:ribosome maturation factor RimM [Spirochaetales bacterium]